MIDNGSLGDSVPLTLPLRTGVSRSKNTPTIAARSGLPLASTNSPWHKIARHLQEGVAGLG
jgi:hypothetical protein